MIRPNRRRYHCPLCKHVLTKEEYDRVTGLESERKKRLARLVEQANADAERRIDRERNRDRRTISRLKAHIVNLEQHTDQSEIGRAWDGEVRDHIAKKFETLGDMVALTPGSRNGDVLHTMRHNGRAVCSVVIECKTSPKVSAAFVRQASKAKRFHNAKYALLVCTGKRAGFDGGVKREGDVFLVKPAALLHLLTLIREVHVELARSKATATRIDEVGHRLVAYVSGPKFKSSVESIVKAADDLDSNLEKERKQMQRSWERRSELHRNISIDSGAIRKSVDSILEGRSSKTGQKVVPLRRFRRAS